jgi:hypothetical protein
LLLAASASRDNQTGTIGAKGEDGNHGNPND